MTMIKWQPRNQRSMGQFDRMFHGFHGQSCGEETCSDEPRSWAPRVDITEGDGDYGINIEVPGVEKSAIAINVEDGHLTISGERKTFSEDDNRKFRRQERFSGKFQRRFALPEDVEIDDIKAEFNNGLLSVSIPKGERVKGRSMEVK